MSIIDYELSDLKHREKFAFTNSSLALIYEEINKIDEVLGSVIISTCNRTEIYLNLANGSNLDPFSLLCDFFNLDYSNYKNKHNTLFNENAIYHLFEVACGMKSQIWGEDQIITQVKNSLISARENKATDATMEVLFRSAVSGAKKVKSTIDFKTDNNSTAKCAVKIVSEHKKAKKVLVIGNGEIGRLTADILVKKGIDTTMTLRSYKYGESIIPCGVKVIDYKERYKKIEEVDAVVSATSSPHFTVDIDNLSKLVRKPSLFIDLAVPRDIDPLIEKSNGVLCYNIDNIDTPHITQHKITQKIQVREILTKYYNDFVKWYDYKHKLTLILADKN